jgi:hypothetical protein
MVEKALGKLTCHSIWLGTQREGKKKKEAPMASSVPDLGEIDLALYREGGGNGGGDGMFQLMAELIAVIVEVGAHPPGPFIGRQGRWRR